MSKKEYNTKGRKVAQREITGRIPTYTDLTPLLRECFISRLCYERRAQRAKELAGKAVA